MRVVVHYTDGAVARPRPMGAATHGVIQNRAVQKVCSLQRWSIQGVVNTHSIFLRGST